MSGCKGCNTLPNYRIKTNIYTSKCFIPVPTFISPPPPPAASYIIPSLLGPVNRFGMQDFVPLPQTLNTAESYFTWAYNRQAHTDPHSPPSYGCCGR